MRCEEARLALWPAPGPRPATGEYTAAFVHYQQCASCQEFFAAQQALGERLRRLSAIRAPAALRKRLQQSIARDVAGRQASRRRTHWLAGGGLLVATAAALILMLSTPQIPEIVAQPLIGEAAQAFSSQTDNSDVIATSDAKALRQWFIGRVHYPVDIPQIEGAKLLGGRIADLGGARTAAVVYMYRDRHITYFPLPSREVMGNDVDWDTIAARSADGFELALWQERGLARAVVAEMPRADLMSFAERCRAKALRSS